MEKPSTVVEFDLTYLFKSYVLKLIMRALKLKQKPHYYYYYLINKELLKKDRRYNYKMIVYPPKLIQERTEKST